MGKYRATKTWVDWASATDSLDGVEREPQAASPREMQAKINGCDFIGFFLPNVKDTRGALATLSALPCYDSVPAD